jgi:hypothetical protein
MAMFQTQYPRGAYADYLHVRGVEPRREAEVGDFAHYLLRPEDFLAICEDPDKPIGRALDRTPLTADEIARIFSAEHRDRLWERYREAFRPYDSSRNDGLDEKLPPPIVVGIQALLPPAPLIRFGSLVHLTTYSPTTHTLKTGEFLVVGAFHTGLYETDLRTVYMPLGAACEFCDLYDPELPDAEGFPAGGWRVSGVGIALDDYDAHKQEVEQAIVRDVLPKYRERIFKASSASFFSPFTMTWEERKKNLLQAVKIEKAIVSLIIGILVVFVGAIIFLILTMNVIEKRRDIGILKAIGASNGHVLSIFLLHGGAICALGLALGFTAGLEFSWHINEIHDWIHAYTGFQLFPPDIYYMDRIPVATKTSDLAQITGFTVLFGFLGSLVPAIWAARQDPIQAIRFE